MAFSVGALIKAFWPGKKSAVVLAQAAGMTHDTVAISGKALRARIRGLAQGGLAAAEAVPASQKGASHAYKAMGANLALITDAARLDSSAAGKKILGIAEAAVEVGKKARTYPAMDAAYDHKLGALREILALVR